MKPLCYELTSNMTKQEREELTQRYFEGETELRDQVIVNNVPFVGYIVRNKFPFMTENNIEDMMSVGIIGLIKAVDSFDINKGYRFATFASRVIYNEIAMEFRKTTGDKRPKNILSLDTIVSDSSIRGGRIEECTLGDIIADKNFDLEKQVEDRVIFDQARSMTGNMKRLIREVMQKRYFNAKQLSQKEVAQDLNTTQSYVSRLERKGIDILKGAFGA